MKKKHEGELAAEKLVKREAAGYWLTEEELAGVKEVVKEIVFSLDACSQHAMSGIDIAYVLTVQIKDGSVTCLLRHM
jgi:hypothetical protein